MRDKGGFRAHLDPNKGNFVDHDLLFGPLAGRIELAPTSSSATDLARDTTGTHHAAERTDQQGAGVRCLRPSRAVRTHGDVVPTNHGGELKLYFGTDRIIKWQGGTVAYATSVKSVPAVLSSARDHGLENYPDFYTVNSAEATQIMGVAEDIHSLHGVWSAEHREPYQITDDPNIADKIEGDLRGLCPRQLVYSTKVVRPLTPSPRPDEGRGSSRRPTACCGRLPFRNADLSTPERRRVQPVPHDCPTVDREAWQGRWSAVLGLSSIFLDRDALFRSELAEHGEPDQHGRVMLQDWELGLAVNHALRYIKPDEGVAGSNRGRPHADQG